MDYVNIALNENEEPIELPLEEDKTLLFSTLSSQFSNASGLKFRTKNNKFRAVRCAGGKFYLPERSESDTIYYCVINQTEKQKPAVTDESLQDDDATKFMKETLKVQEETLKELLNSLKEFMDRVDKKHDRFLEMRALFSVREVIKLMIKRLQHVHSESQFSRLPQPIAHEKYVGKKRRHPKLKEFQDKLKEFQDNVNKLILIESKVKEGRNRKGHPIDDISKVSFSEFCDDLKILLDTETHIISDEDAEILKVMAKYAGMK